MLKKPYIYFFSCNTIFKILIFFSLIFFCNIFLVPSKPQNLTVLDVTATSITMSWHPPKNQNGAIAGYHVFHIHENQTGVEIVKRNAADSAITFELPKLSKYKPTKKKTPDIYSFMLNKSHTIAVRNQ